MDSRYTLTSSLSYRSRPNGFAAWTSGFQGYYNHESMLSFNNMPLNYDGDSGSEWKLHRDSDTVYPGLHHDSVEQFSTFDGQFSMSPFPTGTIEVHSAPVETGVGALQALGTTAIARVEPTNPAFEMSTFIGETITGGAPSIVGHSLWKERAQVARGAGSEYLNYQFGWVPLLSDIRGFMYAVKHSGEILDAYRKGSDLKIRRGYKFPVEDDTKMVSGNYIPAPTSYPFFIPGTTVSQKHEQIWFSGAFKYHIPVSVEQMDKFQLWGQYAEHVLGVEVTPETLWNIAPWSWAVDWFSNTGDLLHNVSALGDDGLVMQYGYLMKHSQVRVSTRSNDGRTARTLLKEWKQRTHANPYGFGVDFASLSGKQVAILAALGLSRS